MRAERNELRQGRDRWRSGAKCILTDRREPTAAGQLAELFLLERSRALILRRADRIARRLRTRRASLGGPSRLTGEMQWCEPAGYPPRPSTISLSMRRSPALPSPSRARAKIFFARSSLSPLASSARLRVLQASSNAVDFFEPQIICETFLRPPRHSIRVAVQQRLCARVS